MRKCIKIMMVFSLLMTLWACGKKSEVVSLEKDGQLYEVADLASFYYPKDFEINVTSPKGGNVVQFVKEDQLMFYATIQDGADNPIEDMPTLYQGQLEVEGASDVVYKSVEIESGLVCQEFTGQYEATGIHFKHMVYFTADSIYVLGYQSIEQTYEDNVEMVTYYLNTLTVNHK